MFWIFIFFIDFGQKLIQFNTKSRILKKIIFLNFRIFIKKTFKKQTYLPGLAKDSLVSDKGSMSADSYFMRCIRVCHWVKLRSRDTHILTFRSKTKNKSFWRGLREGSGYQIGWIFREIPNGLRSPPSLIFGKLCCIFYDRYGCIYARRYEWPDSMKCMHMISRDRDHSEGWGWGQLPFGTFPKIHPIW